MANPNQVQVTEESFFRDFVDNGELRLQELLLTEEGREILDMIKSALKWRINVEYLPIERKEKLLAMAMIQHAVSQILLDIARAEDNR